MKNSKKIWLDDKTDGTRPAPEGFEHVTTAQDAINRLEANDVDEISLDHDLGNEAEVGSGYMVAKYIEDSAFHNIIPRLKWHIHTQNVVGRKNIKDALERADKYWEINERKGNKDG